MHMTSGDSKFVIYYNVSDIVLGIMLLSLVAFFIHNYITTSSGSERSCFDYATGSMNNSLMNTDHQMHVR